MSRGTWDLGPDKGPGKEAAETEAVIGRLAGLFPEGASLTPAGRQRQGPGVGRSC